MDKIFELTDKNGKQIYLSKERWKHILVEHPDISKFEELMVALERPTKIIDSHRDPNVKFYFVYKKKIKRYLKVSVKYLNGDGFIITAHHTRKIQ